MNANEIIFGVELETTMPTTDTTQVGSYHHGIDVPWLRFSQGTWKAEKDSSIRESTGRRAVEFVSPKLKGYQGIDDLTAAASEIEHRGGKVNETCGLHITITWTGDAHALARLLTLFANHEKGLYASTGTKRRERTVCPCYSKPLKQYGDPNNAKARMDADRFHAINLTHLACGRNRIEFRLFAGTLNCDKIVGYVCIVLGLVELALKTRRQTDWSFVKGDKKRGWDRKGAGEGECELARLFYRLNWRRGPYYTLKSPWRFHKFGVIEPNCMVESMKVLLKMARKYDAATE